MGFFLQKKSNDTIALKMLSDCYQKLNAYDSALFYKEKAVLLGATKTKQLAELYANNNDYAKAKDLYAYFLSEEITKTAEARLYGFKNTAGMLADSLDYRLHNLSINTPFKLSIFNNEILPWSSINNESKTVSLSFLETKLPPKSILE